MPLPLFSPSSKPPTSIRHVIGVAAGKGGVGKSTVAVNLALSLNRLGFKVGILDADLYGPSIRKMMPEETLPLKEGDSLFPALSMGIKVISMAFFGCSDKARAVRAPVANSLITQFLDTVKWGALDFLIIDFPPGTGDIQLTLAQKAKISGALMVTTPQEVANIDVAKAIDLFKTVNIPIFGIVENMSYLKTDAKAPPIYPFGQGGGKRLAELTDTPFLGCIPIDPLISSACDQGISLFQLEGALVAKEIFMKLAHGISSSLESKDPAILPKGSKGLSIKKIWQIDDTRFGITWNDSKEMVYTFGNLQENCPCARCHEARTKGTKSLINPDVQAASIENAGNYALRIRFREGCSLGIYDFDSLYHMGKE